MSFIPLLLIQNTQTVHSGVAATESFRNEMVKGAQTSAEIMLTALNHSLQNNRQLTKDIN